VVVAVVVGFYHEIIENRFLAFRCTAAGAVLAMVLSALLQRLVVPYSLVTSHRFAYATFSVVVFAACLASVHLGKSMAAFHRHYRRAFILLYIGSFCSVLYFCWLSTLLRFEHARTTSHVIVGGAMNYVWILSALLGSGLFEFRHRTAIKGKLQ